MTSRIDLTGLTIHPEGESTIFFSSEGDDMKSARHCHAAALVCLDVDGGDHDDVVLDLRQSEAVRVLDRTIAALTAVRERYARMVPEESRRGRCMASADWGRCVLSEHGDSSHEFPTQAEWEAEREALFGTV